MAKMRVDFSGVSDSGAEIPPGKYLAKVKAVTQDKKEGGEYPYLKWELVILSGAAKGLHINHITTLKPSGLFSLRDTLVACGLEVPKSAVAIDPDRMVGKTFGIETSMRPGSDGNEYPNVKKVFRQDAAPVSTGGMVSSDDEDDTFLLDGDL